MGPAGAIDINLGTIIEVMKLKGVENMGECLDKVQTIAQTILKAQK
jgi:hypothetical protein